MQVMVVCDKVLSRLKFPLWRSESTHDIQHPEVKRAWTVRVNSAAHKTARDSDRRPDRAASQ